MPLSKLILCLVMLLTAIPFFHELGHYSVANLQGIEVYELELIGFDPHVTTKFLTIPFLLGGQLYIPMFFYIYWVVFGKIYNLEWTVFIVGIVLGSSYDIIKILNLIK